MNFLQKLLAGFGMGKKDVIPARPLKLEYDVLPANAASFANQFVEIILANERVGLNYSIGTLAFVDQFLERFNRQGVTVDKFAETIFVAGCYVGQTILLNAGGTWITDTEAGADDGVKKAAIVLKLSNGAIADPITRTFRRFIKGESQSLLHFYQALTQGGKK